MISQENVLSIIKFVITTGYLLDRQRYEIVSVNDHYLS